MKKSTQEDDLVLSENESNSQDGQSETEKTQNSNSQTLFSSLFTIDGYVSTCSHNAGRSTPDYQYLYVNKRPCQHAKLAKLINEQFHQFNRNQYPMFVLNIVTHTENVDVNVTPDKLQMFIRHEATLMAIIKSSLTKMYTRLYTTVNLSDTSIGGPSPKTQPMMTSFIKVTPNSTSTQLNKLAQQDEENKSPRKVNSALDETGVTPQLIRSHPEGLRQVLTVISPKSNVQPPEQHLNRTEMLAKTPPPKRTRDQQDLSPPSEFLQERVLKQPKLTLNESGSPKLAVSPSRRVLSPSSKSKSPPTFSDLLNKRQSPLLPQHLSVKPIWGAGSGASSTCSESNSGSPFSLNEKKSLFANRIGSPVLNEPVATSSLMDNSFADRIDLHMCNRRTAVLDSPEIRGGGGFSRRLNQDEGYF